MASPLADAHIEALRRLRVLTTGAVGSIWTGLPGYDRENIDEWLTNVLPVIDTARRASISLTDAYLAQALARPPIGVDPARVIDTLRNGTPASEVYQRPFVTVWTALKAGTQWQDAVHAGLARAAGAAAMDVQLAMRGTAEAVQQEDGGVYGYARAADPGACEFCSLLDGAFVKSADAMPLHNNCGCGLEPLTAPHPSAAALPSGVAVHDHGELGPVLADPAHDFTTAALALS